MLEFPPGNPALVFLIPFFIMGVAVVGMGGPYLLARRRGQPMKRPPNVVLLAAAMLLMAALFGTAAYNGTARYHRFSQLPVGAVTSLTVWKVASERDQPLGEPVMLTDAPRIQEGLALLARATPTGRNHESFRNGCRVQLQGMDLGKDAFIIEAMRERHASAGAVTPGAVLLPALNPGDVALGGTLGEYECAGFLAWLDANVEPLFRR